MPEIYIFYEKKFWSLTLELPTFQYHLAPLEGVILTPWWHSIKKYRDTDFITIFSPLKL